MGENYMKALSFRRKDMPYMECIGWVWARLKKQWPLWPLLDDITYVFRIRDPNYETNSFATKGILARGATPVYRYIHIGAMNKKTGSLTFHEILVG